MSGSGSRPGIKKATRSGGVKPISKILSTANVDPIPFDKGSDIAGLIAEEGTSETLTCNKCSKSVSDYDDRMKCDCCKNVYHFTCTDFNKDVFCMLAKHSCFNKILWCCDLCKDSAKFVLESDTKSSNEEPNTTFLVDLIAQLTERVANLESKSVKPLSLISTQVTSHESKATAPDPISHQVYVIPKENEELTLKTFSDIVRTDLPNIPIKRLGINKKGHGYIKVPDKKTSDEVLNSLASNYNAVAESTSQREFLPKITISDINSEDYSNSNKNDLKTAILNKNPDIKSLVDDNKQFDILFITKDRTRNKFSKAIVKIHPDILKLIKRSRYRIYIDFATCRVSDRFFLKQCYRCQKFGHHNDDCSMKAENKHVCRFCSDNHESSACRFKGSKNGENFKCANCSGKHATTDVTCTVLQKQVDYVVSRTKGCEGMQKNSIPRYAIIT